MTPREYHVVTCPIKATTCKYYQTLVIKGPTTKLHAFSTNTPGRRAFRQSIYSLVHSIMRLKAHGTMDCKSIPKNTQDTILLLRLPPIIPISALHRSCSRPIDEKRIPQTKTPGARVYTVPGCFMGDKIKKGSHKCLPASWCPYSEIPRPNSLKTNENVTRCRREFSRYMWHPWMG